MFAASIRQTGSPDVIEFGELPTPAPGPHDVLVKVAAAAVNPIDTYIRSGAISMGAVFPYIPGCDVAGVVEACGEKAERFRPGDRVWGSNQGLFGRQGTCAEYAAIHEDWLYPTPASVSDEAAAAGALTGITAHLGLFVHAGLHPNDVVFVNGGAGGVGSAVIQLAAAHGATVIATAGSAENRERCLAWGAAAALDYRDPNLDAHIRETAKATGGATLWFETQREPTLDRTVALMAPRGRIVLMAGRAARPVFPVGPFYVKELRMVGFAMFNSSPAEQRFAAIALNDLAARGRWAPPIGLRLPMSQTAEAHRLQEANTIHKAGTLAGKIVLAPGG